MSLYSSKSPESSGVDGSDGKNIVTGREQEGVSWQKNNHRNETILDCSTCVRYVDGLLRSGVKVGERKNLAKAGIDVDWFSAYGMVAERFEVDRNYGPARYPYEAGPSIREFYGGFFDHK